jgi:hydrogenase expression/formation protein HypC
MCLAIPGRVEALSGDDALTRSGRVSFGGAARDVSMVFVPQVVVGDYVLVHVGFALDIIDPDEAEKTLALLEEMGGMDEFDENGGQTA